ncbi:MAG: hypothetical protein PHN80_10205 [Hespellia sp.]|nr:hypothetical protein [Hespellia sp.]
MIHKKKLQTLLLIIMTVSLEILPVNAANPDTAYLSAPTGQEEMQKSPSALILSIDDSDRLSSIPVFDAALRSTPSDDGLESLYLLALSMQTVTAAVETDAGESSVSLSVSWDFSDIDVTTEGDYAAIGTIEVPEGYAFAENVLQEILIPVHVAPAAEPVVITSVEEWYPHSDALAIAQGSDISDLEQTLPLLNCPSLRCYDESGESYRSEIVWNFDSVDLHTVGLYEATGHLLAPENTVFAEDMRMPEITIPISVQAEGSPDINCFYAGRGMILFPWVTPPGSLENVTPWLSVNGEDWTVLEDHYQPMEDCFLLYTAALESGNDYRLQIDYEGGQTGILSFSYDKTVFIENYAQGDRDGGDVDGNKPSDIIQPAPDITPTAPDSNDSDKLPSEPDTSDAISGSNPAVPDSNDAISGSKPTVPDSSDAISGSNPAVPDSNDTPSDSKTNGSGSDHTVSDSTASVQSPVLANVRNVLLPHIDNTSLSSETLFFDGTDSTGSSDNTTDSSVVSNDSNTSFLEKSTDTYTLISGLRLKEMLGENGDVRFSKQNVTITLPGNILRQWAIQDGSRFKITITRNENQFSFLVELDGKPMQGLTGTIIMLPFKASDQSPVLALTDKNNEVLSYGTFDSDLGIATFTVDDPGTFLIEEMTDKETLAAENISHTSVRKSGMTFLPVLLIAGLSALMLSVGTYLRRRWKR